MMPTHDHPRSHWAHDLGLAQTALLAQGERPGSHALLLDGVSGSFGLSLVEKAEVEPTARNWAWSSGVLHHVTSDEDKVIVQRWDKRDAVQYRAKSVEDNLERFYHTLTKEQAVLVEGVTDHAVDAFRRLRSHFGRADGNVALSSFLLVLAAMIEGRDDSVLDDATWLAEAYDLPTAPDGLATISKDFARHLIAGFRKPVLRHALGLETLPDLLLRHTGASLFQEAHLEAVADGTLDFWGIPAPAAVGRPTQHGIHYTPPGLARALVEQVLAALSPLPDEISVLDPACGSGSILHEFLRTLRDRGYRGTVNVTAFDVSTSAIMTTRFFLAASARDWPDLRVSRSRIERRDALSEEPWPACDVVVMNPPFVSLRDLSKEQRTGLDRALGTFSKGRPDLSMAFVERAAASLREGGVLASLVPAGVLGMTMANRWRTHLLETHRVELLASFGELGLFRSATVEVGALVLRKSTSSSGGTFPSLWVGEKSGSASEALRFLRRTLAGTAAPVETDRWSFDDVPIDELGDGASWRPRPRFIQREIRRYAILAPGTVSDVFVVRQGALPAPRDAFIVSAATHASLGDDERRWFRKVAENENVKFGQIIPANWIFFSKGDGLPSLETEADLAKAVPTFYPHLLLSKGSLAARRGKAARWWELGEDRSWLRSPSQKIVTAYFGQAGSFALDREGDHVVVQGYGWLARRKASTLVGATMEELLNAYVALCNTLLFQRILSEFCPPVGGGQLNLSKRFVERVPLPDLAARLDQSDGEDATVRDLASIGGMIMRSGLLRAPRRDAEELTTALYGLT